MCCIDIAGLTPCKVCKIWISVSLSRNPSQELSKNRGFASIPPFRNVCKVCVFATLIRASVFIYNPWSDRTSAHPSDLTGVRQNGLWTHKGRHSASSLVYTTLILLIQIVLACGHLDDGTAFVRYSPFLVTMFTTPSKHQNPESPEFWPPELLRHDQCSQDQCRG